MRTDELEKGSGRAFDKTIGSISPSTSVREALASLEESRQQATVVIEGGRPIGVITASTLRRAGEATIGTDTEVQDVMDLEVVHVDPSFGVEDTLRAYRDAAWASVSRRRPFAQ